MLVSISAATQTRPLKASSKKAKINIFIVSFFCMCSVPKMLQNFFWLSSHNQWKQPTVLANFCASSSSKHFDSIPKDIYSKYYLSQIFPVVFDQNGPTPFSATDGNTCLYFFVKLMRYKLSNLELIRRLPVPSFSCLMNWFFGLFQIKAGRKIRFKLEKIQFIKLDNSNWRIAKIKCR